MTWPGRIRRASCRCRGCRWPTPSRWPARGSATYRSCGGCPGCRCCAPTSRSTSTWRASASRAPTCGARCSVTPAAAAPRTPRPATTRSPRGIRCRRSTRPARSRSSGAGCPGCGRGPRRPVAASRPTATTRTPRTAGSSGRRSASADGRGCPRSRRSRSSSAIRRGSTSTRSSTSGSSARTARGSSASPPPPGSRGAIPRRAGRTPCGGTAMPSASTARRPIRPSGSGCWSTTPMTSPPPTPSGCG